MLGIILNNKDWGGSGLIPLTIPDKTEAKITSQPHGFKESDLCLIGYLLSATDPCGPEARHLIDPWPGVHQEHCSQEDEAADCQSSHSSAAWRHWVSACGEQVLFPWATDSAGEIHFPVFLFLTSNVLFFLLTWLAHVGNKEGKNDNLVFDLTAVGSLLLNRVLTLFACCICKARLLSQCSETVKGDLRLPEKCFNQQCLRLKPSAVSVTALPSFFNVQSIRNF